MSIEQIPARATPRLPAGAAAPAIDQYEPPVPLERSAVPIDQFGSWRLFALSFVIIVVLPVLCVAAYYYLIAASIYAVEFRFSVRSAAELVDSGAYGGQQVLQRGGGGGGAPSEMVRLPYMAANYLRSRNVVRKLDEGGWLRAVFSRPQADWLSRFNKSESADALWRYWRQMVSVNVERISGLVLVRVQAFTPDDALALARATSLCAERMIDSISMSEREERLRYAEHELHRASLRYSDAITGLRDVRNQESIVDLQQTITSSMDSLLRVMRQKLTLERERDAGLGIVSPMAPQQKVLSEQIQALDTQIATLSSSLTSQLKHAKTLSQSLARFETQELEVRFAKTLLEIARAGYERARQESERQHIYFVPFVEPVKPAVAEYPLRARKVAFAGLCALAFWSVLALAWAGIRDHKFER